MAFLNHYIETPERGQAVVHGYPVAYRHASGELRRTIERFEPSPDGWLAQAVQGVHEVRVAADGTRQLRHMAWQATTRLVGIAAVQPNGNVSKVLDFDLGDTAKWSCIVGANTVTWAHADGYRYTAAYTADTAVGALHIPTSCFAALRGFLPGGAVAFGPIFSWDESGDWPDVPGDVDTTAQLVWRKGNARHSMRPGHAGETPVRRIRARASKYLVEALPRELLDGAKDIDLADSVTYQQGVGGYTGCEDTWMYARDATYQTYNYGVAALLYVGCVGTGTRYGHGLMRFDVSAVGGTITAATLAVYNTDATATTMNGTLQVHAVLAANTGWIEGTKDTAVAAAGEPTWGHKLYNTVTWAGSAGCSTSGTDYAAGTLGTANWTDGVAGALSIALTAATVEAWRTGTNDGMLLRTTTEWTNGYAVVLSSSENGTTANRPSLAITYTPASSSLLMLAANLRGNIGHRTRGGLQL